MINLNLNRISKYFVFVGLIASIVVCIRFLYVSNTIVNLISELFQLILICDIGVFVFLIIFEQINDIYRFRTWKSLNNGKLFIGKENFECGYCGNKIVTRSDRYCSVCGKQFEDK